MSESSNLPFDLVPAKLDSTLDPSFSSKDGLSTPPPAPVPSRRFRSSRFSRISDPVAAHDRSPLLNGGNLALLPGFVAMAFFGVTHLKEIGRLFASGHTGLTADPGPAVDLPFWIPAALALTAALGLSVAAFVFLRKRARRRKIGTVAQPAAMPAPVAAARPASSAKRTPFGPVLRFSAKHRAAQRAERAAALAQAEEPTPVDPFASGSPRRMQHESVRTLPADVRFSTLR